MTDADVPLCPACRHPVEEHFGRWCRVATGARTVDGRGAICCCTHVDASFIPGVHCQDCGTVNPVWFAPSRVWNHVMSGSSETKGDPGGFICPACFIARADARGYHPTGWLLTPSWPGSRQDVLAP